MLDFEWDPDKAQRNLRNHRVAFREAATVFRDPLGITGYDPDHSEEEDRYMTIGASTTGRLLMVAHTDRHDRIRIISARELTRLERQAYEDEIQRRRG
ncbi:MAG: BrnT family toxin [bacterium]|nr:BrnT family toxin [bacterium]